MIGRIYRIIHLESEICYIGSTFNELRHRWQGHKDGYVNWLETNTKEVSIFQYFKKHGIEKFKMILVKEYEVVDKKHLEAYEQLWIEKFKKNCVNQNAAFRINKLSSKKYEMENKEMRNKKDREYYQKINKSLMTIENKRRIVIVEVNIQIEAKRNT